MEGRGWKINPEIDAKERRNAWIIMILCPISLLSLCIFTYAGVTPGIEAGHDPVYLVSTCIASAVLSMLLPILRLLRVAAVPKILTVTIYLNIYLYLISLHLGMYKSIDWWGSVGHILSSSIATIFVFLGLCIMQVHSPSHVHFGSRAGICILVFIIGMSLGGLWEMAEGLTDILAGQDFMVYGAIDTLGDLISDTFGALVVALCAYWYLRDHTVEEACASIRFGRNAFQVEG